ncbi:uncharacterized protein SOCE26_035990 [Sorangium cellulosum]|uniref:PEGA domain-containing protein n=1 Tax=Sorangium cellulosum TaxID=56 RepID=A0A2L0ESD8_SORCE|nr:hypothetical protein [Sorangium cellulosum]AUX42172.1 uncharacterized protein SOCE26_035990 [Sorangium cellulosum]
MHAGGLRRSSKHVAGAAALLAALAAAPGSSAQTREELDQARALFQEAVALSAANNCAAALAKFQAVARVRRTPQVVFNIAECEERLGKLVSALGNYRLAAAAAAGDPKAKDVTTNVGARIEALEERIPKLAIRRGEGALTATILLDGFELGAPEMSAEIPVDPGTHVITARIGDREVSRETVTVAERDARTVDVVIDEPSAAPPPVDTPPPVAPVEGPAPAARPSKVPGLVVLGAGIASGAVGGVFLVLRGGTLRELDTLCGGDTRCPPSAKPTADRGRLYTGVAEAAIGLGVVGVATGILLLATSGGDPSDEPKVAARDGRAAPRRSAGGSGPRAHLLPQAPGADVAGLSVAGRF